MMGLAVVAVGLACGIGGFLVLQSGGSGWRIGRLLAAAPQKSLGQAVALAMRGEQAYVRLHGRIDSDEEFPDQDGNPVVFQRRRLQRRVRRWTGGPGWETFDEERLAVPFRLTERGEQVAIDVDALGDGLVVVPRVSEGVAADLAAIDLGALDPGVSLPAMPDATPVAMRLEPVRAVDHATACGVPRLAASGDTVLGPGLGRPLILTTLELDEAMRILGSDHRSSLRLAAGLLVAAPLVSVAGLLLLVLGP